MRSMKNLQKNFRFTRDSVYTRTWLAKSIFTSLSFRYISIGTHCLSLSLYLYVYKNFLLPFHFSLKRRLFIIIIIMIILLLYCRKLRLLPTSNSTHTVVPPLNLIDVSRRRRRWQYFPRCLIKLNYTLDWFRKIRQRAKFGILRILYKLFD